MCEHIPDESNASPPADAVHATTNTILQKILAHNQELMCLLAIYNSFTRNHKSHLPIPYTKPRQGQPRTTMPEHYNNYCRENGSGNHNSCD